MTNNSTALTEIERLLLEKQRLELHQQRDQLSEGFGLMRYTPHKKQDLFHRAGDKKRRGIFAGNRFGKSHCGCAEDCAWLYGERVWYGKTDPARKAGLPEHPVKGLVITTDWDKVEEVWTSERGDRPGKLWQFLPRDFVKSKRRNHSGAIETVEGENGSLLHFDTVKSYMANPQGSESSDWDFIHVDEPCPEKMFKAASRGLIDRHGSAWFTLTALTEPWIMDMFSPRKRGGKVTDIDNFSSADVWMMRGGMRENPHLTEAAIRLYEETLTDDEKQCRILGIPMALAGLVYKEFEYSRHVLTKLPEGWDSSWMPPMTWPVYIAVDPHPQTPHALLAATVSPHGQIIFFYEQFFHSTIREFCRQLNPVMRDRHVMWYICDPSAWINDPINGGNISDEFAKEKIYVDKATKALGQGIMHTRGELKLQNRIYFAPTLEETLWEIQRYCWDPKPERQNRPVDKDDHMMENMYRILLSDPCWVDLSKIKKLDRPTYDIVIDRPEYELGEEISLAL